MASNTVDYLQLAGVRGLTRRCPGLLTEQQLFVWEGLEPSILGLHKKLVIFETLRGKVTMMNAGCNKAPVVLICSLIEPCHERHGGSGKGRAGDLRSDLRLTIHDTPFFLVG